MSKKLFLVLVMLLCMTAPSRAGWDLVDERILKSIDKSIDTLTQAMVELVEVERERNVELKEQNDTLRLIKNKLSDIAVLQAIDSNRVFIRYADSEENSGLKLKGPLNRFKPYPDTRIYYYHSEEMKKCSTGIDGDE